MPPNKNHFIAGLCSLPPDFPLHFWCRLLPQAELSLNLLRQSRINPALSSHAQLHGNFNYNRTPLAPPGCKVIVFNRPENRASWDPHGAKAWYIGPAMDHYRCYRTVDPLTKKERIAETVEFLPHNFEMPPTSSADLAIQAAQGLTAALRKPQPAAPFLEPLHRHNKALQELAKIFQAAATPPPAPRVPNETPPSPRVATPTPSPPRVSDAADTGNPQGAFAAIKFPTQPAPISTPQEVAIYAADTPLAAHHFASSVQDEDTGQILEYDQLLKHPKYKTAWNISAANEFGRLAQGIGGRLTGTDTIHFIQRQDLPRNKKATYGRFVCDLRPQKKETERTRLTVGGNLIDYPGVTRDTRCRHHHFQNPFERCALHPGRPLPQPGHQQFLPQHPNAQP